MILFLKQKNRIVALFLLKRLWKLFLDLFQIILK